MYKTHVTIGCLLLCISSSAQIEYAEGMANTIMKQYQDSMVVKKYASHLEQDNLIKPGQTVADAQVNRPANWNYEIGVVLIGMERLADHTSKKQYYDYSKHIIDHFITNDGTIRTYVVDEYNSDCIPPGRQLLRFYNDTKEEKYKKAANELANQIAWQPRNRAGGFWHKLKYPSQMWLDGLYMVEPFYAQWAITSNHPEYYDDIVEQFVTMEKYTRDQKTGLLYHAWDESKLQRWADPVTGRSPEFWSRAMGWYAMALVDVLDILPAQHPGREKLVAIFDRLATALIKYQDNASGVWWQVTNKANQPGNYLESSASAMFVFAMAKALRKQYISPAYKSAIVNAWDGLIKQFVTKDASGLYHFNQAVAGAGLGGTPYRDGSYDYYLKEPKRDDDLKAIGPFIQACVEMDMLLKKK